MATSTQNQGENAKFDIRNFIDQLKPGKEKGKYICPVCGGHNLTWNKSEPPVITCWNGCDRRDIKEAIRPWSEVLASKEGNGTERRISTKAKPAKRKPKPAPIPNGKLTLVRLADPATDVPKPQRLTSTPPKKIPGRATETTYIYSDTQWVVRYQWDDASKPKGYEKTFRQWNRLPDGTPQMKKGDKPWKAYRLDEALAVVKSATVMLVLLQQEGEQCVEICRAEAIAGFTFQGSGWDKETIKREYQRILDAGVVAIIFLYDPDKTGLKKLQLCQQCASEVGIRLIAVNPHDICPNLPYESSDIKEILEQMEVPEFIRRLEEQIHAKLEEQLHSQENEQPENKQNATFDTKNPESFYKPLCESFRLPFENCVTVTTFDGWVYRHVFGSAEDWRVIDSAFYSWSSDVKIWQHQPDNRVLTLIADAGETAYKLKHTDRTGWQVIKPYETNSHKESAFKYVRNRLERPEPLPSNTHLLAFHNCVVDLRTGQQMPHSKEYYLTNIIPHEYKPNKQCPEDFRQFIINSFGEDMLEVIRAFTSMFLDPTAPYGRFPHLIGQSGGGKGTLGRFWSSLFGDSGSGSAAHFADISTPEGRHQFLTGKRIFGFPDVGGYAEGVRAFYELIDNGPMSGRALFNPVAYSKQWYIRFWVASVDHLQVENAGDGWARRAYPIPVKARNVLPDPDLRLKLEAVKAEVISWALAMPRCERDRILLSPPESESAINSSLDAALYGDSTKSFVDLCLRPSSAADFVPHHLLHSWYVAYCKEHGYTPLGMSKFISHLKTVLPRNFQDRSWTPMVNGRRDRIPAHWENLAPLPDVFVSHEPIKNIGENPPPQNRIWTCVKSKCEEGGLMDFEDFWNPPEPPSDGHGDNGSNRPPTLPTLPSTPPSIQEKSLEPSETKDVQSVQGENFLSILPENTGTTQNQGCPRCPTVQGEVLHAEKVSDATQHNLDTNPIFSNLYSGGGQTRTPWTLLPELGFEVSTPATDTLDTLDTPPPTLNTSAPVKPSVNVSEIPLKPLAFPLKAGDHVKCYPTYDHCCNGWDVVGTVLLVEAQDGHFLGCTVEYYRKIDKVWQLYSDRIPGGSPEWILKKL